MQELPKNFAVKHGKVRDIYDLENNNLLIVATDRISAFDRVFPTEIPDKGKILTKLSKFWSEILNNTNYHLITTDNSDLPSPFNTSEFADRTMLVKRAQVVPFEFIVRGYLSGSAWNEYKLTGSVCGIKLPKGLKENHPLPKPLFTPSTKAESGHDENVSFDYFSFHVGKHEAIKFCDESINLYLQAASYAWNKGIIIADTKFEWGWDSLGNLMLIDEVLTPDSSRFWPIEEYELNKSINSLDKQYIRDWASSSGWNKEDPAPEIPANVVNNTRAKYIEIYEKLTGEKYAAS